MTKRLVLLAALALLAASLVVVPSALADSGGATIRALPESEALEGSAEVHHECSGYTSGEEACDWFASASTYSASTECPQVFDASRGSWVGSPETTPGVARSTFTIEPYELTSDIRVCLYVNTNSESSLVGQSHVFDRTTGRELIPTKSTTRHCGTVNASDLVWNILIYEGPEHCATAKAVLISYLHGDGRPEHKTTIVNLRRLTKGWLCGEIGKGLWPTCVRRASGHSELIQALEE